MQKRIKRNIPGSKQLVGSWINGDEYDTDVEYIVTRTGAGFKVSAIDRFDGEKGAVFDMSYAAKSSILSFNVLWKSTGRVISARLQPISPNRASYTYTYTANQMWFRKESKLAVGTKASRQKSRTQFKKNKMSKRLLFWGARLPRHGAVATAGARPRFGRVRRVAPGRRRRHAAPLQTGGYRRGNDLSGSLEGAGGIGGLLERADGYNPTNGTWTNHNYYHADGNGNITYMESNSQTLAASYRYDAFGNTLASSGALASSNTYRFSSKEFIPTAGFYYYLYRFYDPVLQRWVNRDPIGEAGGINIYLFNKNEPIDKVDPKGLITSQWPSQSVKACFWVSYCSPDGALARAACCIHANTTCSQNCQAEYGVGASPGDESDSDLKLCLADCAKNAISCAKKGGKTPKPPSDPVPKPK